MSDPAFRVLDHGQHFEPRGLWYENVEERVLRDLRKLLGVLGGPGRRPVLHRWVVSGDEVVLEVEPLRQAQREWVWAELQDGVERFSTSLAAGELSCVLEKEAREDRWSVQLAGVELIGPSGALASADGATHLGPARTLALSAAAAPVLSLDGLALGELSVSGGALPQAAKVEVELVGKPGGPVLSLPLVPADVDALVEPQVRRVTNIRGPSGRLATPWTPVALRLDFDGGELVERTLTLTGSSLRPPTLDVVVRHHLGSRQDTRTLRATRQGDAYLLEQAWSPSLPALGRVEVEVGGRVVTQWELSAPPLSGRWRHPAAGGAAPAPRLALAESSVEVSGRAAVIWRLLPDGRVAYDATGQVALLDDHDFQPLAADTAADLLALVVRDGPIEAWLPGLHHHVLRSLDDLDGLELLLRRVPELGPIRLGRGAARGVITSLAGADRGLGEIAEQGGVLHLPEPSGQATRVWFRGRVLAGHLRRLDDDQIALLVDPIDTLDLGELGPFTPLRAWRTESGARLQVGLLTGDLQAGSPQTGVRWRGAGLRHRFPDYGYDVMLPIEPMDAYCWQGHLFDGDLRFCGWLLDGGRLDLEPVGPWAGVALSCGAPSRPELGVSRVGPSDALDAFPPAIAEGVQALLDGARIAPEVAIDTPGGRWLLVPRHRHPRRPPERVEVHPPARLAPPGVQGLRIWVQHG